jgi:hypothetical protein
MIAIAALTCWTFTQRYSFATAGEGIGVWRYDHLTGKVSFLSLQDLEWRNSK